MWVDAKKEGGGYCEIISNALVMSAATWLLATLGTTHRTVFKVL